METTQEASSSVVTKETYLNRLAQPDKVNVESLADLLGKALRQNRLQGKIVAVGSSVAKDTYNDLDLLFFIEDNEKPKESWRNEFDCATAEFTDMSDVITDAIKEDARFHEISRIPPYIDQEYGNPNILAHDGAITLQGNTGKPIEIVRGKNDRANRLADNRPRVLLNEVK